MAPLKPIARDTNASGKRAQEVLDRASRVSELLRRRSQLPSDLAHDLDSLVKRSLPLPQSASTTYAELDSLGCTLWNASTNILRDDETTQDPHGQHDHGRLVLSLRVFAFYLLHSAQPTTLKQSKDRDRFLRNFKIALKTCRFCVDKNELDLARKVLETASDYVSASKKDSPLVRIAKDTNEDDGHRDTLRKLETEFYLLQMTYAWKIGKFDTAEHHYNQISTEQLSRSGHLTETAADLFYVAGKSLSKQKLDGTAVVWFERAIATLDACEPEQQSQDAGELRLTITTSLVECLLRSTDSDARQRAQDLAEQIAVTHGFGKRMAVQLMYFNILMRGSPVDDTNLTECLLRLIRSTVLTDRTFRIIMQTIHRARKASKGAACGALQRLITDRLLDDLAQIRGGEGSTLEYLEKACVTYVYFATSESQEEYVAIDGLEETLNTVAQRNIISISAKATHAAQTLIWKAAGASTAEVANRWCNLLRHSLFDSAGHVNKARIGRKAMSMAMGRNDTAAARETFFNMPASIQNDSLTRYLAFKLAVRSNDYDLALESLKVISKQAKNDHTHLFACVLEAQQSQMRPIAVAAMQAIVDKEPSTAHLPTLLRCTVRLLLGELDANSEGDVVGIMTEVVHTFENAASSIVELKRRSGDNWRAEVQWWSKNSYNLALKWCEDMNLELLIRLLSTCITFIDSLPNDGGVMHQNDVKRRKALCCFLSALALVLLARDEEEGSENNLQAYLQARQQIEAYNALLSSIESDDLKGFRIKTFELLKLDLECILHLHDWKHLESTLQACIDVRGVERWDTLADIILIMRQNNDFHLSPNANDKINRLLDRIINETWQRDKNIVKAARWLRVSFSLDLQPGSRCDFALKLLHQAAGMAKKGKATQEGGNGPYPETELQWLATTAFNKAVDLLESGTQQEILEWIDGALEVARYADDEGALHANLSQKKELVLERLKGAGR